MRHGRLAALVGLSLACVAAVPAISRGDSVDRSRAIASYAALQRQLVDPQSGAYLEQLGAAPGVHAWPLSQALAATLAVARLPGAGGAAVAAAKRQLVQLAPMRGGAVYRALPAAGSDIYYDDNEWIAQDLLDAGAAAPARWSRGRASAIFAAVVGAWDADTSAPCSGGVRWTTAAGNVDRNTVTTANGALVGLRLYSLTGSLYDLAWAERMLDWIDRCMLAPDGLYWDHIGDAGAINEREWSYNQGSALGAFLLLYETTGDVGALARAQQLGDATLAAFDGRWLASEPPEFAAIFFRNLLALAAVAGRPDYVAAAQSYADDAWTIARDPATGLFSFGGPTRLLDQAALVQVYAALAARP